MFFSLSLMLVVLSKYCLRLLISATVGSTSFSVGFSLYIFFWAAYATPSGTRIQRYTATQTSNLNPPTTGIQSSELLSPWAPLLLESWALPLEARTRHLICNFQELFIAIYRSLEVSGSEKMGNKNVNYSYPQVYLNLFLLGRYAFCNHLLHHYPL